MLDSYRLECQKVKAQLDYLQQERMKQESIVRYFENNNEEYIKIRKAVEEKVHSVLSPSKILLKLALLSLVESMRNNPDKYSPLIYLL